MFFGTTHVPSKSSSGPYFLEIGPQFPNLIPNLASITANPKLRTKVKTKVQTRGELGMILRISLLNNNDI